jgi:hypothetical protein
VRRAIRWLWWWGLTGLVLVPYTLLVLFLSEARGKELLSSPQPADVRYHSYDPYVVGVSEGPISWRELGWSRSVVIGVAKAGFEDGHEVLVRMPGGAEVTGLEWTREQVEVRFASGHRLVIPKGSFIGGR